MDFILRWLIGKCQEAFGDIYQMVVGITGDLFSQSVVQTILVFFKTIGLSMIGLAMVIMLFKSLINHADGKEFSITDILKRFIGGTIIYYYGVDIMCDLYIVLMKITGKMISAISNIATDNIKFENKGTLASISTLLLLIMIVMMIFFLMKSFLNLLERVWQYLVLLCMMYLYLMGYIIGNDEALLSWFKQCLAVIFTQFFQVILVTLGMALFVSNGNMGDFLFSIGAIIAASKVEQTLDKYGMGAGGRIGNALKNGMSMGFYANSFLKKR